MSVCLQQQSGSKLVTCKKRNTGRGLRIGLQRLPAYILQGGTNLSPQVSLDWPGSESSTVQSREDEGEEGEGGAKDGDGGGGGGMGKHCINALSPSTSHMYSNTDRHKGRLALHALIMTHGKHRREDVIGEKSLEGHTSLSATSV